AVADAATRARVGRLIERARTVAADQAAPEAYRLAAVQLLGREPGQRGADVDVLGQLLSPRQPAALQAAAATALGRIPGERPAAALLAGWTSAAPALKSQLLNLLLSRDDGQRQLLEAIAR